MEEELVRAGFPSGFFRPNDIPISQLVAEVSDEISATVLS